MIISTLYRCDNCGEEANGTCQEIPEHWHNKKDKDLCPTCIRIYGKPVINLSHETLLNEVFTMNRLRRLRS
jgi:hypothetical protein